MTSKKMEPIDKELARKQWNELMKKRTQIRRLVKKGYTTPQYQAKLEVYKDFFEDYSEIPKIIVQYLKGEITEPKVREIKLKFRASDFEDDD